MIQNALIKLDNIIYMFGFAPDLKLRIAFGTLIAETAIVGVLFLFLAYVVLFRKNLNFLKKEVL